MRASRSRIIAALAATWLAACATAPATPTTPPRTAAPTAETAPPPVACEPAPAGLAEVLARSDFLVIGELHGTNEAPRQVAAIACNAAAPGPVTVAVELPITESDALAAYVRSSGGADDRASLLAGAHWQRPSGEQDGRSSEAVFALIERVRVLRAGGVDIDVRAFDVPDPRMAANRDATMAENLAELRAAAPGTVVVLTGNLHARSERGTPWDASFVPMAAHLRERFPRMVTFDLGHAGGDAWICMMAGDQTQCGARRVGGDDHGDGAELQIPAPAAHEGGYDGVLFVGTVTASPPAVEERRP